MSQATFSRETTNASRLCPCRHPYSLPIPALKRDYRITQQDVVDATPAPTPVHEGPVTPEHIAAQLMKLYNKGIVKGPDDPEVMFYCLMIRDFGATVIDTLIEQDKVIPKKPRFERDVS